MRRNVVVLSGPIASGKTILAQAFGRRLGYFHILVRDLLQADFPMSERPPSRHNLQHYGSQLEHDTLGRWLAERVSHIIRANEHCAGFVVDSARTRLQVEGLRAAFDPRLVHIHLSAAPQLLEARFQERSIEVQGEAASYQLAAIHEIEGEQEHLLNIADLAIDTSLLSPNEVYDRASPAIS